MKLVCRGSKYIESLSSPNNTKSVRVSGFEVRAAEQAGSDREVAMRRVMRFVDVVEALELSRNKQKQACFSRSVPKTVDR